MISSVNSLYDAGKREGVNQDSILIEYKEDKGLFVIADGMGGYSDGEVASRLIVDGLKEWWLSVCDSTEEDSLQDVVLKCLDEIVEINGKILTEFKSREVFGGSTLVALIVWGNSYSVIHVGDSRAYRFFRSDFTLLTEDDIWDNLESTKLNFTQDEIKNDKKNGKLTMAVGVREDIKVHYLVRKAEIGEQILLCSDGIYKYCDSNSLKGALSDGLFGRSDEMKLKKIEKIVISNGALDNYSAILCRIR